MSLRDLFRELGLFSKGGGDDTRRPDGGTSYYSPLRRKAADFAQQPGGAGETQRVPYVHTGFTGMTPPSDYGYETGPAFGRPAYQKQAEPPTPRQNNISYMPGFAPGAPDRKPIHIEHIMTLTGLKSCYEAIECMKNGETLIVMLDAIANESESLRCQDMLAGAAFTLGCTVRLLAGSRIVVIAPEGVIILPERQNTPGIVRPPEFAVPAPTAVSEAPRPGRRERRTGAGAATWEAARNGELNNYNPYTGTMPAAAGSYGSFGGYGY